MRYARLGGSGLTVSRIALGMMSYGDPAHSPWYLDEDRAEPIVRAAAQAGVTLFDTADMYSAGVSEEVTGRLLRRLFVRREEYVLATKVYYPMGAGPNDRGLSRAHVMTAVDASLRRLGADHIDLYQVHRWDPHTPVEETMCALHDLVRAGKVRYLGASLMYAWQCAKAQHAAALHGWTGFVSMQTRYNLLYREEEREMLPYCADAGLGILPYSPLAQGALAVSTVDTPRSAVRSARNANPGITAALTAIAADHAVPPARIALAWLLANPVVAAPVVGATKPQHLTDALAAETVALTTEEIAQLEKPYQPQQPYGYT